MTKEEWTRVETRLREPYERVNLIIDGYNVSLITIEEKPLHYHIAVLVDGGFKAKWTLEDCEIRKRFCMAHKASLLKTADRQKSAYKKLKKTEKAYVEEEMSYTWYAPFFSSFRTLKSHFLKNNETIELAESQEINNGKV